MDYRREEKNIIRDKYQGKLFPALLSADIDRLRRGEPLAYIIGYQPFLNCHIDLRYRPLIPRPETEFWVEQALAKIKKTQKPIRCLDIFAGSGCIGLAVLRNVPKSRVVFADQEEKFLKQIRTNLGLNKISKTRVKVVRSDVFKSLLPSLKFDYIFANPPYIPSGRKIAASVGKWEPAKALRGGKDGLFYIRKFLRQAKNYLQPGGKIFLEFDSAQKKTIETLARQLGYAKIEFYRDQYDRFRWAELAIL